MKKFLIKFVAFLLLVSLCLFGLGYRYNALSPVAEEWQKPLEEMPQTIDLAVTGSSHALFGIDLSPYSDSYFNFAMSGQTPQYDYAMLREFEGRIADGATLVMTVSYMSPFWTEYPSHFAEKQNRYYRTLSKENIIDYDASEALRIRLTQAIPAARILFTDVSTVLQTFQASRPHSAPSPGPDNTPQWVKDLDHQLDVISRNHLGVIEDCFPDMNPDVKQAYENIFALAKEHSWNVVLVTPPFPRQYSNIYDEEFFTAFYGHIQELCDTYGATYWDFSHDPHFIDSPDCFGDIDHLNPKGCKLFSSLLAEKLGLTQLPAAEN